MGDFRKRLKGITFALAIPTMLLALSVRILNAQAGTNLLEVDDTGTGWDLKHLKLDVTFLPASGELLAEGNLRVKLTGAAASTGPDFELNRNGFEFISVSSLAQTKEARVRGRLARIRLSQPCSRGDEIEVSVKYKYRNPGGIVVTNQGAHASGTDLWYPSPSNREGELNDVDVAGDIRFQLPENWQMLSAGKLTESIESGGFVTQTWASETELGRGFLAGPFAMHVRRVDDGELRILLLQPDTTRAAQIGRTFASIKNQLAYRFGPFPHKHYGIAEVPSGLVPFSGRSLPGLFIADTSNFDRLDIDHLILAHEAAHAWWGNVVKVVDPGSQLLIEGLAHYSVSLVIESLEGERAAVEWLRFGRVRQPRRFRAFYQGLTPTYSASGYFNRINAPSDKPLLELQNTQHDFNTACSKGVWFYHMLRHRVGDDMFFSTLRSLIARYSGKPSPISFNDFRKAFTDAAGSHELEDFFRQWSERVGAPIIEQTWKALPGRRNQLELTLWQEPDPFDLELRIAVDSRRGTRWHTVRLSQREQTFVLDSPGRPTSVRIDPEHRLLIWSREYGLKPSLTREADVLFSDRKWKQAGESYEAILASYPTEGRLWYNLGTVYYNLRSYDKAISSYERALNLGYLPSLAAYNIASAYSLKNEKTKTLDWLHRAFSLGFRDRHQLRTDDDFNNLRMDSRFLKLIAGY